MSTQVLADVQFESQGSGVPTKSEMESWIRRVLDTAGVVRKGGSEISIRVVDEAESRSLNRQYRHKDRPTNVLAFAIDLPDVDAWPDAWPDDVAMPLGDLVICAPVVAREATEQGKALTAHWSHMLVHGMLHLLGYEHETDAQAQSMETLETEILQAGGVKNPYEDARMT